MNSTDKLYQDVVDYVRRLDQILEQEDWGQLPDMQKQYDLLRAMPLPKNAAKLLDDYEQIFSQGEPRSRPKLGF